MKNILLAIILVLITRSAFPQAWQWSNPRPTSNDLESCYFTDENTGYSVGAAGLILKTNDAGLTWNQLNSGTKAYLSSVVFIDQQKGFCIGLDWKTNLGILLSTNNSGESWEMQSIDTHHPINQILFTDSNNGFIIGDKGKIFKTSNGGENWEQVASGTTYSLFSIYFIDSQTGWIAGWDNYQTGNGVILKTTDGGNSWSIISSDNPYKIMSISFVNQSIGYAAGWFQIFKTTDGGNSWTSMYTASNYGGLLSICCKSEDSIIVVGQQGTIVRSNNGGSDWDSIPSGTDHDLHYLYFGPTGEGFIVGQLGTELKKNVDADNWQLLSYGEDRHLNSIRFTDSSNGYCIVGFGCVLKTTDSGSTWSRTLIGENYILGGLCTSSKTTLHFYGSRTVSLDLDSNFIFRTTDAGQTWNITYRDYLKPISSIFFPDSLHGFAVGYDQMEGVTFLLNTTNSGASWSLSQTFPGHYFNVIFFADQLTGYIAGYNDMLKTSDGGSSWEPIAISGNINSLWFIDPYIGFASGSDENWNPLILKTIDGGTTWTGQQLGSPYGLGEMTFPDSQTGYVIGAQSSVFKTIDCGSTWELQEPYTDNPFSSICSTDASTVYIAGTYGTILKTTTGGTVPVKEESSFIIPSVYPNPASTSFTLEISKYSQDAYFKIFNINGQDLINGKIKNNKTLISVNKLSSGLYFLQIIDHGNTHSIKIMKE